MNNIDYKESHESVHPPIWIRLPRQGSRCGHTGLSRGVMHRLVAPCIENDHSPPVESKVLLKEGKKRGVRLVSYDSLIRYIACFGGPES